MGKFPIGYFSVGNLLHGETMNTNFSLDDLHQFSGSEQFFRHQFNRKLIYTEGVQYLAENANCYWLINEVALVLLPELLKKYKDHFYSIKLLVNSDHSAVITVDDGNNNIHIKRKIRWTDFPVIEKEAHFYLCESEGNYCLMLNSEY
jgi:hypothetical protein